MSERFYIDPQDLSSSKAILKGSEAVHLTKVMRARVGDEIFLFTGDGLEYRGCIESIGHAMAEIEILETRVNDGEPEIDLTMAVALPKGDRQKWLIEKLTELGVRRFIPLRAKRSDIRVDHSVLDRLKRQVIEASKQCGRCYLMEILPEMSREEIASQFPFTNETLGDDSFAVLCHPISDGYYHQVSFLDLLADFSSKNGLQVPKKILLIIGPVGGFSEDEVMAACRDGWPILDLGRQVYRVETAALCAASLFLHLAR